MLYVSDYDKSSDKYAVTDTDDNTKEWHTSAELFSFVQRHHIKITGVDLGVMAIKVVNPGMPANVAQKFADAGTLVSKGGKRQSVAGGKSKKGLPPDVAKKFADAGTLVTGGKRQSVAGGKFKKGLPSDVAKKFEDAGTLRKAKKGVTPSVKKRFEDAGTLVQKQSSRFDYLSENVGFDYIVEQHEGRDFTEFVVSTGGDVVTYRVSGSAGNYSLRSK